ncbi:MAG: Peptidoglycan glycosyltransferase, partial [Frankiales bacterium]|nr:Peptidoglycan glycosyltransferase [Frankiales bacterium]
AARPAAPRPPRRVAMGRPRVRLRGGLLAVLVMLSLIGGRLVWLQGFQAEAYASEATKQRLSTVKLAAPRGSISDRNGQVLALSVDARAVYAEPRTIAKANCPPGAKTPCEPTTIAAALAPVLGLPAEEIESKLVLSPKATGATCSKTEMLGCKGFAYLARGLEAEKANEVRALGLVGIGTVAEPRRVAPGGQLGANVLGFTTVEGAGTAGVEDQFDSVLAGKDGKRIAEVDGGGRIIPNGYTSTVDPEPGRDVQLTIDRDLQWFAQKVLADKIAEADAESGSATLMDVTTGEILALVSVPTFDANEPGKADASIRGNRAVSDVFEPGSIGKVITAAAALEQGVLTPDSIMPVADKIRVSNKTFSDSHSHPVEQMTFTGVLVESSNVGTIMAAQKVGGPKLHEMLTRFGIGAKTGVELPAESRGILRDEKDEWSGTDYGTHPIGQGYSVNGVQMASVYATVANGGVRVKPTILKGLRNADGTPRTIDKTEPQRVISQQVADQLRGMLEGVTNEGGTAVTAAIPGYRVAGKTGTARRVVDGRYDGSYTASFVGFAPADAPRLVLSVSVQAPRNGYYGGAVAGPVFSDIMKFALRSMQVPPTGAPSPKLRLRASD